LGGEPGFRSVCAIALAISGHADSPVLAAVRESLRSRTGRLATTGQLARAEAVPEPVVDAIERLGFDDDLDVRAYARHALFRAGRQDEEGLAAVAWEAATMDQDLAFSFACEEWARVAAVRRVLEAVAIDPVVPAAIRRLAVKAVRAER